MALISNDFQEKNLKKFNISIETKYLIAIIQQAMMLLMALFVKRSIMLMINCFMMNIFLIHVLSILLLVRNFQRILISVPIVVSR